jgi:hypothetical protein
MRRRLISALLLASAACRHPYTAATGAFATSTAATVEALRPMMAFRGKQCHLSADYDWLFKNLSSPRNGKWPGLGSLSKPTVPFYDQHGQSLAQISVEDYCDRLAVADVTVNRALQVLDSYASALSSITTDGAIDTDSLHTTLTDLGTLIGKLANDAGETKSVSQAITQLDGPLRSIAIAITASAKERELQRVIVKADEPFRAVIKALHAYVAANRDLAQQSNMLFGQAIHAAEQRLVDQPVSPVEAFTLLDRVNVEKASAIQTLAALDVFDGLLSSLTDAQTSLLGAANQSVPAQTALKQVLADAKEVLTQLAAIKLLLQPGKA